MPVDADGIDGALQIAVFMENAFGVSGGTGGVDGVGDGMLVKRLMTGKTVRMHDFFPVCRTQLGFAAAVFTDIIDAFRGIGVLHQRPCRARLPNAYHRDHGQNAARQIDQHEVLFADPLCLEPRIDAAGHIVKLRIGKPL